MLFRRTSILVHTLRLQSRHRSSTLRAIGAVGLGLGLSLARPSIHCEGMQHNTFDFNSTDCSTPIIAKREPDALPPPFPESSVNFLELGFGTVAGICAGVFVKKGAKLVAFFLGGVFVLLQARVDWNAVGFRFKRAFYTVDAKTGESVAPTVLGVWRRLVDFLTADFQPRASFVAGFALGVRIG
ncbi:hypothetical protein C8F01DRAFT_1209556 [Mycena amicta]|nr:hypothetical protein C8F01DRAFT_1209556 [Mycena amicta]